MNVEHLWNYNDRKPKYLEKTLSQYYFVYHKSHVEWPGIAPGPGWLEACDQLPEPWHSLRSKVELLYERASCCVQNRYSRQMRQMCITAGRNQLFTFCCSYKCWCTDHSLLTADSQLNFCVICEHFTVVLLKI